MFVQITPFTDDDDQHTRDTRPLTARFRNSAAPIGLKENEKMRKKTTVQNESSGFHAVQIMRILKPKLKKKHTHAHNTCRVGILGYARNQSSISQPANR